MPISHFPSVGQQENAVFNTMKTGTSFVEVHPEWNTFRHRESTYKVYFMCSHYGGSVGTTTCCDVTVNFPLSGFARTERLYSQM